MRARVLLFQLLALVAILLATASASARVETQTRVRVIDSMLATCIELEAGRTLEHRPANRFDGPTNAADSCVAAEGAVAAGEGAGATRLFRAVSPAELADIKATGGFRPSPTGLEGKYFSTTAEGASQYARMAVRGFGDAPYTIVETTMPNGTAPLAPFVDRGIPTVVVPNNALPVLARPIVWPFMPIP